MFNGHPNPKVVVEPDARPQSPPEFLPAPLLGGWGVLYAAPTLNQTKTSEQHGPRSFDLQFLRLELGIHQGTL